MNPATPAVILPEPPDELKQFSARLAGRLRDHIAEHGAMPFAEWMERVLYEPGLGYYSAGLHKLGAAGDFVTAPELGPVFAQCLSRQVEQLAEELGAFDLLEVGAGSGRLAVDLLQSLDPSARPVRYRILERSADLREVQKRTIDQLPGELRGRIEWLDAPPQATWTGLLLANEVIDALPVERFALGNDGIEQVCVSAEQSKFSWSARPAPAQLDEAVRTRLGTRLEALDSGYRSELCTLLGPWLAEVTRSMERGCALFVDYGYARDDYYVPARRDGTLVCHYRHRGHDDPFFYPGLQDISAFVDFTAVAEAGEACGLSLAGYTSQAMFLLGCGLDEVLASGMTLPQRERLAFAAQVRELTLPGAMGEKFKVMALARGVGPALRGFATGDQCHRL